MQSEIKMASAALAVLIAASFFSYYNFADYSPKNLVPIKEVAGIHSEVREAQIPLPENHTIIGESDTESVNLQTFTTASSPEETQKFYKNVFLNKDWKIDTEGQAGIFYITQYKNEKQRVKITTSRQNGDDITVVSIETTWND